MTQTLTEKLKWLRKNARVTLDNMPPGPGRLVVVTVYPRPDDDSGRIFLQDDVDDAIEYAKKYPINKPFNNKI